MGGLAESTHEPHLRAQLRALAALLVQAHVDAERRRPDVGPLEHDLSRAIAREQEDAAILAGRRLAAAQRAGLARVDWVAVSGG
ncbi:MAG: hypothetical protein ACYCYN_13060 [Solirubrobacteraceae bacterium]